MYFLDEAIDAFLADSIANFAGAIIDMPSVEMRTANRKTFS